MLVSAKQAHCIVRGFFSFSSSSSHLLLLLSYRDFLHNTISLPNSAILKAISFPVVSITSWACFISVVYRHLLVSGSPLINFVSIPTTPHSLMVSSLGLLLVFRTNSAYQRFAVSLLSSVFDVVCDAGPIRWRLLVVVVPPRLVQSNSHLYVHT